MTTPDTAVDTFPAAVLDAVQLLIEHGAVPSSVYVARDHVVTCGSTWHDTGHSMYSGCPLCGQKTYRGAVWCGKHVVKNLVLPDGMLAAALAGGIRS